MITVIQRHPSDVSSLSQVVLWHVIGDDDDSGLHSLLWWTEAGRDASGRPADEHTVRQLPQGMAADCRSVSQLYPWLINLQNSEFKLSQ